MKYPSSWLLQLQKTKKVHVKVKAMKLEGLKINGVDEKERMAVVEMKWKGPYKNRLLLPFYKGFMNNYKCRKNYSSHKFLKKGEEDVAWDEEFQNVCSFFIDSKDSHKKKKKKNCFSPWHVSFKILYGEDAKYKTKLVEMGKVSLDIGEVASSIIDSEVVKRIPVSLKMDGLPTEATLSIWMSIAELGDSTDSSRIVLNSAEPYIRQASLSKIDRTQKTSKTKTIKDHIPVNSCESTPNNSSDSLGNVLELKDYSSENQRNSDVKVKLWSKRRWSFSFSKRNKEPLYKKTNVENDVEEIQHSSSPDCSSWEVKELVSRDGQTKLKANVFFASFDQRSEKAAGESACAALVAVIAHWLLQSNQDFMPTTSQFDSLIAEGSSEWRKLCNDAAYMSSFPDSHFDLETVLKAELRPVNILHDKSFTGIFSPDKFENLKGAKSFDDIWEEISSTSEDYDQRIYIVSWNDHFFILKADMDAYYIIDSLGERLFEGCNQAYILKFDDSTVMYEKVEKDVNSEEMTAEEAEGKESDGITCKGKECCKEFIKRFLAAIPIRELEEQEEKCSVSVLSLLRRLQIDFHYCSSSSSSSVGSPTSSLFSSDEGIN